MPMKNDSTVKRENSADLAQDARDQVGAILAGTDWQQYWSNVSEQSEPEISAYEAACARSLASASRKFVQ